MAKFTRKSIPSVSRYADPTAILTADWHIRPTTPICRTDDFLAAMWRKVEFVLDLSIEYQCPILIAGDLGLRSQWSNWLEEKFIRSANEKKGFIYVVPGQHDLPDHLLDQWRQSAIGVLHEAKVIELWGIEARRFVKMRLFDVNAFPYGEEIKVNKINKGKPLIAVAHTLVTECAPESFLAEKGARSGLKLLMDFPEYNLILTGDNHKGFVVEKDDRLLVNPGSLMRTTADQADYKPRVYLWYHQENKVEPVYLPIEEGVVDRTHIDLAEQKDARIEAYVARLSEEVEIGLSFEGNLEAYFRQNRIRKPVIDKVWASMPK